MISKPTYSWRKTKTKQMAELEHMIRKSRSISKNTKTPAGRFFFHVMASLAQMEHELIAERTRAGLNAARKLGRVGGWKRQMTESEIASARKFLEGGAAPKDVAHDLGVSVPILYRWLPASARS